MFEVFDCFLPLFYIAFYQLNVVALRRELVGLFWGKCVSEVIPLWDTLFFWGGGRGNWECHLSKKWIICSCISTDSIFRFTNFFVFCLSVFVLGDEIRRLVTESILPYLTEKGHVWKIQRDYAKSKKDSEEKTFIPSQVNALICSSFIYHYNANIATSCIIVFFGFNFSLFLMQFNYIFGLLVVWS